MGEKEDKEKAEKLAAAKKRVAQLQKKKKAADGAVGPEKSGAAVSKPKVKAKKDKDKEATEVEEAGDHEDDGEETGKGKAKLAEVEQPEVQTKEELELGDGDSDEAAIIEAAKTGTHDNDESAQEDDKFTDGTSPPSSGANASSATRKQGTGQPSISLQSKIRSTSFRQSSAPLSPSATEGVSDESFYRKQTSRIAELEEENKRLTKQATEFEARWRKTEDELEELREKTAEERGNQPQPEELEKLREEVSNLRRTSRASVSAGGGRARQASLPRSAANDSELKKELESKESTISDLQLEISRLRSQISAQNEGSEGRDEQVSALKSNVERAETNIRKLEGELADAKKALNRASEKAVIDGTEKTSKETKIKTLERETEEMKAQKEELVNKVDTLEKKVEVMNKLHRETEQRTASKLSAVEAQARDAAALKNRIELLEKENLKLREARKRAMSGGGDDEGIDELEDEGRKKLEKKIRDLEGENFELKRGVWRDKRKELQTGMTQGAGEDFDDVDLGGSADRSRSRSGASQNQTKHSGFTQVLNSGIAAFRSSNMSPDSQAQQNTGPRNDSLLQEFDDDAIFDEGAFAVAQREEEMKKMVEHVREVKKGLKNWVGWRLNLVDSRRGGIGGGIGEVFDI